MFKLVLLEMSVHAIAGAPAQIPSSAMASGAALLIGY